MSVGVCQNTFDQTKSPRVAHRLQPQGQGQARVHKQRTWTKGQFVWRKFPGTGNGHLTRARWVGPGLVITQDSHSVWISMRSRIWKCCSDQLRPANHIEPLGAELIGSKDLADVLEQSKGKRAGAVDVASEGPPPSEAWGQSASSQHEEAPAVSSRRNLCHRDL